LVLAALVAELILRLRAPTGKILFLPPLHLAHLQAMLWLWVAAAVLDTQTLEH
jgi:hypothetical protein